MNPFKIKVTDELSNTKIQEALFDLGCEWFGSTNEVKPLANCWIDVGSNGRLTWSFHGSDEKELTLPQLRDLVVLKRNDVKDANRQAKRGGEYFITSDGDIYFWMGKWVPSTLGSTEPLTAIETNQPQHPALISGAEALRYIACGRLVQWISKDFPNWTDLDITNINAKNFIDEERIRESGFKYRLKPQTIKVELEIPAPYKAKIGGRDDTSFVLNVGRHQYLYQNEDDYTKARDALEAVFDSALRGTNS